MIRPFTCLAVLLAAGSGLYLYTEKHRTTVLDERIDKVVSDTGLIRARTSMLQAEWALLNQPDRLGTLAGKFLPTLQPIAPGQFVQVADLDKRLPAIGPPPSAVPPSGPSPGPGSDAPAAAPGAPTAPLVLSSASAPAVASAGDVATAAPMSPTPIASVMSIVPGHAPDHASAPPLRLASAIRHPIHPHHPILTASAGRVETTDAPPIRRVVSYARPVPILASAWTRPARAVYAPAPPFTGSALGMAHDTMAPPMAAPDPAAPAR